MRPATLVGVALLGVGVVVVGFVFVVGAMMGSLPSPSESGGCGSDLSATGPAVAVRGVGGLTSSQLANADAIITEGRNRRIPVQGVVIALAVASQESHFTNYANDGHGDDLSIFQRGIEESLSLPHEAVGSDHGSLGVFQQQWPWWGSMPDLMNPRIAAGKFYTALLKVPGWQQMPVTVAAQRVQVSAFPDAYADDESLARQLLGGTGGPTTETAALGDPAFTACQTPVADGDVVYPLPRGSGYLDNHNYGHLGGRWARFHTGTDLSVACGTPVLAATSGTVVIRTDQAWAGRWLVQVSTGIGRLTTWYAHMRAVTVDPGQAVTAG